jgi:hypothetical protein
MELVCDMAETYHIYDIKALPARTAAALVSGLDSSSRTVKKLSGEKCSFKELMLIRIYDKVNWLCWTKTRAAQRGGPPPETLESRLFGEPEDRDSDVVSFSSPESFEAARMKIIGGK